MNWQTNFLITFDNGYNLLIDCGGDIKNALKALELTHRDINGVYISHLHGDHCYGCEWLGFTTFFDPACKKPDLYVSESLVQDLWSFLRPSMSSLQNRVNTLDTYFDVHPIERNGGFVIDGNFFRLIQVAHIMDGFCFVNSFGLMVQAASSGKKVFFTTDTQFCPEQIKDFYNITDIIIHDCECVPYQFKSGVHAHFEDLCKLPDSTKKKLYLVHYQDIVLSDWEGWNSKAKDAGIVNGFRKKGDVIEL
jgi:ribonuclease BN (tRNA processing enzyme)